MVEPFGIGGPGASLPLTEPELPAAIPTPAPAATHSTAHATAKPKVHAAKKA